VIRCRDADRVALDAAGSNRGIGKMRYAKAVFVGGVIIPLLLHVIAPRSMPWWPDTASTAVAFGAAAALIVSRYEQDRETRHLLWRELRNVVRRRR